MYETIKIKKNNPFLLHISKLHICWTGMKGLKLNEMLFASVLFILIGFFIANIQSEEGRTFILIFNVYYLKNFDVFWPIFCVIFDILPDWILNGIFWMDYIRLKA